MTKTKPNYDDEIDLIAVIQTFLIHKTKFILLGMVGLIVGLVYTFQHEPSFKTDFKVIVGHPAFSNDLVIYSPVIEETLNKSLLNKIIIPSYTFNKKSQLFSVITATNNAKHIVSDLFANALKNEIINLRNTAELVEGFDEKPVILNNNNNNRNNITVTNQDIAKLNPEQVAQSLKISFGEPKTLYPKPLKHGVIGIFMGLVAAFICMLIAILSTQLRLRT